MGHSAPAQPDALQRGWVCCRGPPTIPCSWGCSRAAHRSWVCHGTRPPGHGRGVGCSGAWQRGGLLRGMAPIADGWVAQHPAVFAVSGPLLTKSCEPALPRGARALSAILMGEALLGRRNIDTHSLPASVMGSPVPSSLPWAPTTLCRAPSNTAPMGTQSPPTHTSATSTAARAQVPQPSRWRLGQDPGPKCPCCLRASPGKAGPPCSGQGEAVDTVVLVPGFAAGSRGRKYAETQLPSGLFIGRCPVPRAERSVPLPPSGPLPVWFRRGPSPGKALTPAAAG